MNGTEPGNGLKMAGVISWLAGVVTGLVVLVLPLGYFFIAYQHMTGELDAETGLIANSINQEVISNNPELWQYGHTRLEEFLSYRLRNKGIETRRVVSNSNEVIAKTGGSKAKTPFVTRSFPLFDSGVTVGRLEIVRSLRPIISKTALFALVTLPFGAATYLIMHILPIRAIRRMEEALHQANAELEQKVQDRTVALDEANKELQTEISARIQKETELRESQQYLSAIIQFYPDATMVIDNKGTIVAWNLAIEELTGVRAEEMLGKGDYEYALPFYGERRPVLIDLALLPDSVVEEKYSYIERRDNKLIGESYINNASGQKVYFHGTAAPLRNSQGEIIGAIESIRDITERKQMEDSLRALSLGIEQSPASIVITDKEGCIEYINPKFTQLTGYTSVEAVGQNPRILKSGLTGPEVHRQLWETILSGGEWHGEFCNKKKNGELYWEFASISPIVDTKGEISRFIAVKEDITEKKLAELALQSKFDLEKIISTISTGFNRLPAERIEDGINDSLRIVGEFAGADRSYLFQINDDGKTADNTHEWCAEGITPQLEKLQGIVPESDFPWLAKEIRKLDAIKLEHITELPPEAANEIMEFEREGIKSLFIVPLSLDNQLIGFMGLDSVRAEKSWSSDNESMLTIVGEILVNALARQRGSQEIHKLNAELERKVAKRTKQLLEAQEELVRKEKLSILGQLSGSVGHELRNPLGVMNNAVYFLKMVHADSDIKTKEYLDIIKHEIDNSQRIINDLLDFARTKTPQTGAISVRGLLDNIINKCVIPDGIDLQTEIPDQLPLLKVDPLQMEQVFQNLITNAVQAMQGSGELRISANSTLGEDFIEISISDTGDGISPENMNKLFQPLFTTKAKGIGLGLVVCRNLVEANGGRIWVESEAGKGTVFNVKLPH